jgi:hypothetical protein
MSERLGAKPGVGERGAKWFRDWNAFWAVALFGAGLVLPAAAPILNAGAVLNVAEAGLGEVAYRSAKKKRSRK